MGTQNVVTKATHLPESGLPCTRKVSILAKFRDFWTPLCGVKICGVRTLFWEGMTQSSNAKLQNGSNMIF